MGETLGSSCVVTDGSKEPCTIVFHDVEKTEIRSGYAAVTDVLCDVDYFPYPPQTHEQLEKAHLYVLACCISSSEPTFPLDSHRGEEEVMKKDVGTVLVGAVGVVWVPFSSGAMVEGYIHVVWVRPDYRRHRVAYRLLERTLAMTQIGNPPNKILRWRLHTMCTSLNTREYLSRFLHERKSSSTTASDDDDVHLLLKETETLITAVPRMYERLGFCVRRNVFKYYDGKADGVEMIKVVPGAGKRR
ncbi:hypothetical protein, conserved [Trypanosoma brucei gambiense DAL972]|uniref:N-acetyltransferase domain-containing protein n=1 Tax=Trypanosoma brucei gambiense (strain MHOM/CI/86/DAL972) TaxID=679716 RepID=C9ZQU4_TRYB9|nr:hypothetical protein, conserved [Trypanosoma brucei gambiense DAL972]CBH11774.1 hypothetical protein, conserved [Trypanosoma brucei gambiense DAL972]|eukprot:XP_011774059.1 hypothetical protein, conserved [Trypanosoma brucei gambiense DAL972]